MRVSSVPTAALHKHGWCERMPAIITTCSAVAAATPAVIFTQQQQQYPEVSGGSCTHYVKSQHTCWRSSWLPLLCQRLLVFVLALLALCSSCRGSNSQTQHRWCRCQVQVVDVTAGTRCSATGRPAAVEASAMLSWEQRFDPMVMSVRQPLPVALTPP